MLRIELAGGLYHVTSRGDRREDIYRDDQDRSTWLSIFGAGCKRFNWRCHAYCQMGNHYLCEASHNTTTWWWKRWMRNQIYLGSEELVEKAARQGASGGNLAEVTRAQRRSLAEPLAEYEQRYGDQHDAMARAYLSGAYSMQGVAAQFGVHYVTVSRAVRRHEQMESSKKRESDG